MIGGFFESYHHEWNADDFVWFERLLEEQDVDIMAWALGTALPPEDFLGPMMERLCRLDFIKLPAGLKAQY